MAAFDRAWRSAPWVSDDGAELRGGVRDAFRELSASRKLAVLSLALTEGALHVAERRLGIRRTTALLARVRLPRVVTEKLDVLANDNALARKLVEFHMVGHELVPLGLDCVSTSISVWWLLRLSGADPQLRVGVRSFGGVFEAHAWVTLNGEVVNDPRGEYLDYTELPSIVRDA